MKFQYEAERIYAEDEAGRLLAEVTLPVKDGVANITHTFVDDSLRGQGVAALLKVAPGTPLLSVERLAFTYGDQPVELRRGLYRTDRHYYRN